MLLVLAATAALAAEDSAAAAARTTAEAAESAITRNPEGVGVGLMLGAPTGFSAAWRPGGRFMVDAGVAWSFVPISGGVQSFVQLHADACIDLADLRTTELPDMHFPVWMGVGPRARIGDGTGYDAFNLAVRVPFGMGFWHTGLPLEGFLEVAPGVGVYPQTEFIVDASLGIRFWLAAAVGSSRFTAPDPEEVGY